MDVALIPAIAALAGSAIGALASLASTWLTQHEQVRAQRVAQAIARREHLFGEFIEEAASVYSDALIHEIDDLSKLVRLYSLVGKLRLSPLPRSSRRQRKSCDASSKSITSPMRICIILKSGGTSRKWMCCAHSAKPAAMTCAFRLGRGPTLCRQPETTVRHRTAVQMIRSGYGCAFMSSRPSVMGQVMSSLPDNCHAAELTLLSVVDAEAATLCCQRER